ncbi:hypothetical protein F4782DRAFT_38324 [Xylaria castorea]|nr:hypothetical protein F4782DRAFT_38324 [Xylaria castorea]
MSAPSDRDQYSTLEVASDADVLRSGKYPEVVPPSGPEVYGYYGPPKTDHQGHQDHQAPEVAQYQQDAKYLPATAYSHVAPTEQAYSTYPEVVDDGGAGRAHGSKGATICGLRRRYFWIALGVAILVVIGVVVGAVVGSMSHHNTSLSSSPSSNSGNNGNSGNSGNNGQGNTNNSTGPAKLTLYNNTQLASANFTDASGNANFLLTYQLSDGSIGLSAFNSQNNKWVASTIINGTQGIKLGTSLALNTIWQNPSSPDVDLYYQNNGSATTVMSLTYASSDQISTTAVVPSNKWQSVAVGGFSSLPGSSLVSYGKQCSFCNQYAYFFWQGPQGLLMAENSGMGVEQASLISAEMTPSTNTSMALTYSGTFNGDTNAILRRSLNVFYRSKTSGLTQLRVGNGMNIPTYVGRDIGPRTNFAAFTTGYNESYSNNPTPLGFQVLSIDPDAGDGVQLTYFLNNSWATGPNTVGDLADCQTRATMTVHTGRRAYCLVDSGSNGGVEIIEWAWRGNPSDTTTYLNWDKVGPVNVGV